ncbi:MAG: hypothetical protein US54_C0071G0005 [Candidatus Roizmanbacteria bacterium GW2011_GWA2_37_7]|uniref:Uncharacterized protein n=1 Tax=Candidatus Roizmanbacteria bacterium GW2011_GWA2_37_7 TaxID=1618481 RepID=A0A0G0GZG1_9BACT|nr:MAG: hypothetical protein US54_C0071G0005 [Candidatus Roizmanbacteria bacterium GW2011_GWA2_37_7]
MKIYSLDRYGRKIIQPIIKLSKIYVNYNHKVNHLILEDGRNIWVSPLHPSYYFSLVKNLKKGDFYDGAKIITNKIVRYGDKYTYDLLPKGETGYYWANRILLASTLLPVMQSQEQAYIKPVLYLHQV